MDKKYIQDLYNQLGGQAKFGSFEDFQNLISTDKSYQNDFHKSFGESTLGSFNDFSKLVSINESKPIQKKKFALDSSSEVGSSELPKPPEQKQTFRLLTEQDFEQGQQKGTIAPNRAIPKSKQVEYDLEGNTGKVIQQPKKNLPLVKKQESKGFYTQGEENVRNAKISKDFQEKGFTEQEKQKFIDGNLVTEKKRVFAKDKELIKSDIDTQINEEDLNNPTPFKFYSTYDKQPKYNPATGIFIQTPKDTFVDTEFGDEKLIGIGIDPADFDGYLNEKGFKKDFLKKEEKGLFEGKGRNLSGADIQLAREIQKQKLLANYIAEQNNRNFKLNSLKAKKENLDRSNSNAIKVEKTTLFEPAKVESYLEQQFPLLTKKLKERDDEGRRILEQHNKGEAGVWYGTKNTLKSGWNGFVDRINNLSATVYDKIGMDETAEEIRMLHEENQMLKPDTREVGYVSGKSTKYDGVEYIVDDNGQIYDKDKKIRVTDLFFKPQYDAIVNESKKGTRDWIFSPQGTSIQLGGVLGDMIVQVALTRGVGGATSSALGTELLSASKLSKIPISKNISSAIIAQSSLGYSQGLEETMKAAKDTGLTTEEAEMLANDAAQRMGILYAVTAPISPQTKATQALFGNAEKDLIKKAVLSYREVGKKGFVETLRNGIPKLAKAGTEMTEEGLKEVFQENIQQAGEMFLINKETNQQAGSQILKDSISVDEFVNTSILSFASAGLISQMKTPTLFKNNAVEQLRTLNILGQDYTKFEQDLKNLVNNGVIDNNSAEKLKTDVRILSNNKSKIPTDTKPELVMDLARGLEEISDLENKKKSLDASFHESIDEQIKSKREEIKNIYNKSKLSETDAVQEQSIELPEEIANLNDNELVTFTVKTLDEVPEQFRDKAKKIGGQDVETRKLILGLPLGKKETVKTPEAYVYSLTGKEAKDYAVQEQSTTEIPVQSETGISETVAEGISQPEPEVITEQITQEEVTAPKTKTISLSDSIDVEDDSNRKGIIPISELDDFIGEDRIGEAQTETSRENIDKLKEDISKNGFKEPIVLVYDKFSNGGEASIIEGNHRIIAAKELGFTEIPVRIEKGVLRSNEERVSENMFPLKRKKIGAIDDRFGVSADKLGLSIRQPSQNDFITNQKTEQVTQEEVTAPQTIIEEQPDVVKVKKSDDFINDAEQVVSLNGEEAGRMYYDRSSKAWRDPNFDKSKYSPESFERIYGDILGDTKQEATDELIRRKKESMKQEAPIEETVAEETVAEEPQGVQFSKDTILNNFLNKLNSLNPLQKNPIDNKSFVYGDKASLEFNRFDKGDKNEVSLEGITSLDKGKGLGKEAMTDITKSADELGTTLTLDAKPFGREGLGKKELIEFYKKNGFEVDKQYLEDLDFGSEQEAIDYVLENESEGLPMVREPKIAEPQAVSEEATPVLSLEEKSIEDLETAPVVQETASAEKKIAEATKKLADKVRELKVIKPDVFSSATPGSLAWDLGVEAVAKSIEVTGDIAQAISDGLEAIKNTDWYKELDDNTKSTVEDTFRNSFDKLKENVDEQGQQAISEGYSNMEDFFDYMSNNEEFNNLSEDEKKSFYYNAVSTFSTSQAINQSQQAGKIIDLKDQNWLKKLITTFQNKMIRIKDVQEQIESTLGVKILNQANVALKFELLIGKTIDVIENKNKEIFDRKNKNSLFSRLISEKGDVDELGMYMYALHAPERNEAVANERQEDFDNEVRVLNDKIKNANSQSLKTRYQNKLNSLIAGKGKATLLKGAGSGMTNEQAQDIIDFVEQSGKKDLYDKYAKEFREKVIIPNLDEMLKYELINQETYDLVKNKYTNYVPLQVIEKALDRKKGAGVIGASVKGKDIFKAKGSDLYKYTDRYNPIYSSMFAYDNTIIRGERNIASQALINLAEMDENNDVFKIHKPKYIAVLDANGDVNYLFPTTPQKIKNDSVELKVKGKPVFVEIKDKAMRDAINEQGIVRGIRGFYIINNWLRNTATLLNPDFIFTNIARDIQGSAFNIQSSMKDLDVKNITRKIVNPKNIAKAGKGLIDANKGDFSSEWAIAARELAENGGVVSWFQRDNLDDYVNDLKKDILRIKKGDKILGKILNKTKDTLLLAQSVAEQSIRLNTFKALKDAGVSLEEAAREAKNITVNFENKGTWSGFVDSLYLFATAGLSGTARTAYSLAKSKRARQIAGGIFVYGILESIMNNAIGQGDDDDELIDDGIKERNLVVVNPLDPKKEPLLIPLAYGINVFKHAGNLTYDVATGRKKPLDASVKLFKSIYTQISPFQGPTAGQAISPTMFDPIVQQLENKNWLGNPIKTEQPKFGPQVKESGLYFESVRPSSKWASKKLNEITGGSAVESGYIDISPEILDHYYDAFTGGTGRFLSNTVFTGYAAKEEISSAISGKEIKDEDKLSLRRLPFVKSFFGSKPEQRQLDLIYDVFTRSAMEEINEEEMTRFKSQFKSAIKSGALDRDSAKRIINSIKKGQAKLKSYKEIQELRPVDMTEKQLKNYKKNKQSN